MASEALELALALYRLPIQRHALRGMGLPHDIGIVIQLASAPQPLLHDAACEINETEVDVVDAARFYLQQVLFQPDADAYRVLGVGADATQEHIREHYRWLQRWLHPDRRGEDWEASLATRVNWAWGQLRNDKARLGYAAECARTLTENSGAHNFAPLPTGRWKTVSPKRRLGSWSKRIALGISFGSCLGLLYLVLTQHEPVFPDEGAVPNSRPAVSFATGNAEAQAESLAAASEPETPAASAAVSDSRLRRLDQSTGPMLLPPRAALKIAAPSAVVLPMPATEPFVARAVPIPTDPETLKQDAIAAGRPVVAVKDEPLAPAPAVAVAVNGEPHTDAASVATASLRATRHTGTAVANIQNESVKEFPNKSLVEMSGTASGNEDDVAPRVARPLANGGIHESTTASPAHETAQTNAALASATEDKPQSTESVVQSESDVSAPSVNAVSRIDLARERIRELAFYFGRLDTPSPPVWNDASGEIGAEHQRTALHGRTRLPVAGDFDLDTITWRMSENATAVSAVYHLHRGLSMWESGHFSLEMVWREKMWLVTRVELDPTP